MTDVDQPGAATSLHVMAIVEDAPTAELIERTLGHSGDTLSVATDLAEGLARAAAEAPDAVLIDVALGNNAGLAVVHHLRAVAPRVSVYALTLPEATDIGVQAIALGGTGLLMLPLSGDELMVALSDVRGRLAQHAERRQLERDAARSRRSTELMRHVADLGDAATTREAAERLLALLGSDAGVERALVYLGAGAGSRQLMQTAAHGAPADAPSFCDDMDLMAFAEQNGFEVLRLTARREHLGLLLIERRGEALPFGDVIAAQAATVLALIAEREQSKHGAMKDPSSSAYTFAYFVDVAGREIDKARRHGRRFSLATLTVERHEASVEVAERVLTAVRDTDVLARVDEQEFYLLLPETGGVGAHTCRRRIIDALEGPIGSRRGARTGPRVSVGLATYPHDGTDLSQLLRVAKHRAERSWTSAVRRLELERLSLAEIVDALFWDASDPRQEHTGPDVWRMIELPTMDLAGLAVGAMMEALRGGAARIVATQHPGLSIGAALRSALGRDRDAVRFDAVDVTGVPGCAELEAMGVIAEHGAYALIGRADRGVVRVVHAADPLLVDLMTQRLGDAVGARLVD